MQTFAYSTSGPPSDEHGCEVCLPRKGSAHTATHTLRYFGVAYDPSYLKHPFRPSDIVTGTAYETSAYNVGQLCHQRLKLYHAMKHFKLHVMLTFKSRLKKRCIRRYGDKRIKPPSKRAAYELLDQLMEEDEQEIKQQFNMSVPLMLPRLALRPSVANRLSRSFSDMLT
jgi:hypothetical protein